MCLIDLDIDTQFEQATSWLLFEKEAIDLKAVQTSTKTFQTI